MCCVAVSAYGILYAVFQKLLGASGKEMTDAESPGVKID